jgi:phage-related protein (TIGR01555 family)
MFKWLASLFAKPVQAGASEPPRPERPGGFFSTDADVTREGNTYDRLQGAIALSFQRGLEQTAIAQDAATTAIAQDASIKSAFLERSVNIPEAQVLWYASQGFIGYQMCALLAQNWLINKACAISGEDAIRKGYMLDIEAAEGVDSDKIIKAIQRADRKYGIRKQAEQLTKYGRIFGIRLALFKIQSDDPDFYEKPFNPDGITPGSYRGISQIDPYWITPELDAAAAADPASMHFYEPTYWRVGGKRYHRSHFVINVPDEVPDILKPSYLYGGLPLTQQIYERVYAAERSANEAPQLLLTKRSTVLHTDVDKAMADQATFEQKLAVWIQYRDNYGVKVLGLDEIMEQFDTTLSDVDAVIMTCYQLVAAVAKVPATKLLSTSPKGFNATGEYDESSYHETLESIQTHEMTPLIERHHLCAMRSDIAPRLDIKPVEVHIDWNPVDAPTEKEQAEINSIKAQTAKNLFDMGAIDGMDERDRLKEDVSSGYAGLVDIEPGGGGEENPLDAILGALAGDSMIRSAGEYEGATLVTYQAFLDESIVEEKIAAGDYAVQVSPDLASPTGRRIRWIVDGHHSLEAARRSGVEPVFQVEPLPNG